MKTLQGCGHCTREQIGQPDCAFPECTVEQRLPPVIPTREYTENCIWAKPTQSTPPVENSKAPGGPGVADGQGVCTCAVPCQLKLDGLPCAVVSGYMLSFTEPGYHHRTSTELCVTAADAAVMLRSLLGRGISSVTVDVLL